MKRTAILCLLFLCSLFSRAQHSPDSCTLEISLLTVSPGTELYSLFGHTAIRVKDSVRGMDIVYNYGFFDDSDPMFYVHFTKGIMRYSVNAETMDSFLAEYLDEHRSVIAQVLNLTCAEKKNLYEALRSNTLEENRFYDYHFHTDNCTTRAGRIIESNTREPLVYGNVLRANSFPGMAQGISFRGMIHEYLDKQQAYWPELGIDILLGSPMDRKPTNLEAIHFLPFYLYRGMDSAKAGIKPMVLNRENILRFPDNRQGSVWFTPVPVFSLLLLFALALFLFRQRPAFASAGKIFDIVFFALLGLIGILISFLWLARVDDVCRDNINILWALPTHIIAVFFIPKNAARLKYYFLVTAIIALVLLIGFAFWFQAMNPAVLPILVLVVFRSFLLFQNQGHAKKSGLRRRETGI